ncbi:TRAP transporter fused permease subunit [Candidatus Poribacteria bacterium]|nr:TRAP transporter fused permease subunit [Candidatus Poribacteria bacterium]MYB65632.1 TRAP transporter fused permease subunit [Candidatus Poribacteria bacterium]MYF56347.1 TRAP transporter fused permease subunit [Candidatus Poribacteria bacterium]MYI94119.1 TRAP transporter fused permease subunit [Candidatus Poribacteria bacterium]
MDQSDKNDVSDKNSINFSKQRSELKGVSRWIFAVSAVFFVAVYIYSAGFGSAAEQYHLGLYLLFTFSLIGILYKFRQDSPAFRPSIFDIILVALSIVSIGYWIIEYPDLANRAGAYTGVDIVMGGIGLIISFEVSRRTVGWGLPIIAVVGVLYGLFGRYMPDAISHQGFSFRRIIEHCYYSQAGVFGIMANVMATYVILFIFFGAFLEKSGVGQFFIDLPMSLTGRSVGGAAKVSVVTSGFFGSVAGSAIANTVTTGAFTIPLMKRTGFRPHIAGAVEASASVGGQFLPPVMGAGAFLIAERTGIPYSKIALLSVVPAVLYFMSVWVMVHYEAKKQGLEPIPVDEIPKLSTLLRTGWFYILPLLTLIGSLMLGYSAYKAAFYSILVTIVVSYFRRETRLTPRRILEAMVTGAKNSLAIGGAVGTIGIIVGVIDLTSLGRIFPDLVLAVAGDNRAIAVLLLALASLVLGMGIPVTAAYLITSELAVPILTTPEMGISIIAAHLIIFWLSQDSNITPPVALGAYAGAAIARADPWKTGWACFKFAKLLYIMPLLFAYTHILFNGTVLENVLSIGTALVGTVIFSILTMGYFIRKTHWYESILLAVAAFLAYTYNIWTFMTALVLAASVLVLQKRSE